MKKLVFVSLIFISAGKHTEFKATWYGKPFHGRLTRSGEIYDMNKMTCATKWFPLGTRLKVINPENKKYVIVKVNDTKKYNNTLLDLSKKAFSKLSDLEVGVINVKVVKLK
jgi:rare lipoprotein A